MQSNFLLTDIKGTNQNRSALQSCSFYRGSRCMKNGIHGTKRSTCPCYGGVRKEGFDCNWQLHKTIP